MTPRETGAAAIWAAEHDMPCEWETVPQADQEMYLRMFDAAVAAYTLLAAEQGWKMVPEQATEEMQETFCVANTPMSAWRFFCKAAPKFELGE